MLLKVSGGFPLVGNINISGAKNASLPLMVASILTEEKCSLTNLPDILDVRNIAHLLESVGAQISFEQGRQSADFVCKNLIHNADPTLARMTRASMWVLGALLARLGRAHLPTPGGCNLGRKMDLHFQVLEAMGAQIDEEEEMIKAVAKKGLFGTKFTFAKRSVGATINAIMAAVLAKGETCLLNCAEEPEVTNLCDALKKMGAQIDGIGSTQIEINGVNSLHGITHKVIGDRLEAGTYAIATAITCGNTVLQNISFDLLSNLQDTFYQVGVILEKINESSIKVSCSGNLKGCDVTASPHPAFPTDLQPIFTSLMCIAQGTSKILENVHCGRFLYALELRKMGANIIIDNSNTAAIVSGVQSLKGCYVKAHDLRGGAALLVAALAAKGETIIHNAEKIYRGYQKIEVNLANCGAQIQKQELNQYQ
jgi:UDP-N-acetylglucosamine 1-carboxyvinyltransferase